MGILDFFQRLLRQKSKAGALESASLSFPSASERSFKRFNTLEIGETPQSTTSVEIPKSLPTIELQKDSLQLGVAAGYTGRALKEIESSLTRIESQIVTKDWFTIQFEDRTPELIEAFKKHDEGMQKQFETIENLLGSIHRTVEKAPEPIKTELFEQIRALEAELPLSPKMEELISIVKEAKEISYTDLESKLGITRSSLRGLLSNTIKRTSEIDRFEREGKGWVRYKTSSSASSAVRALE